MKTIIRTNCDENTQSWTKSNFWYPFYSHPWVLNKPFWSQIGILGWQSSACW